MCWNEEFLNYNDFVGGGMSIMDVILTDEDTFYDPDGVLISNDELDFEGDI